MTKLSFGLSTFLLSFKLPLPRERISCAWSKIDKGTFLELRRRRYPSNFSRTFVTSHINSIYHSCLLHFQIFLRLIHFRNFNDACFEMEISFDAREIFIVNFKCPEFNNKKIWIKILFWFSDWRSSKFPWNSDSNGKTYLKLALFSNSHLDSWHKW